MRLGCLTCIAEHALEITVGSLNDQEQGPRLQAISMRLTWSMEHNRDLDKADRDDVSKNSLVVPLRPPRSAL